MTSSSFDRSSLLDSNSMQQTIQRMADQIQATIEDQGSLVLVGIQKGGVILAKRLSRIVFEGKGSSRTVGILDIGMHRDDLDQNRVPEIKPTDIPFDVTGKSVVLVDDVLFSGRTIRAAMDAITDLGRPGRILLAVLVDRGHRELPIKADFVGEVVETSPDQFVDVQLTEEGIGDYIFLKGK
jgi:pyrimidine operon attenuation protein/uracil phosphoribosyltransferase